MSSYKNLFTNDDSPKNEQERKVYFKQHVHTAIALTPLFPAKGILNIL